MMRRTVTTLILISMSGMRAGAGPTEDALRVGEEALAKKEYSSAITTWTNAYNERATANTANDETCAKLLLNNGQLLGQLARYKESAICYENLLILRSKLNGETHPETQKVKALLAAQTSNSGGDVDRAEKLVREAEEALSKAGNEYFDDHLLALTNLAGILYVKKDRLGAHELYSQVVALCEKHPTKSMNLAIEACSSMASIAEFFGRSKDKIQYLRRAVELSRKHIGTDDPATYLTRIDLASAQSAAGLNADAKSSYESIISDMEKKSPPASDKLLQQRWAIAAYRLAYVESALSNQDRVYELIKSSLTHAQAGWGDLDANTLPIYLDLAKLHLMRKNFKEGVKCYQKVLDIRRRELGPDDSSTKETQKILNELLEDVRKAEAAGK